MREEKQKRGRGVAYCKKRVGKGNPKQETRGKTVREGKTTVSRASPLLSKAKRGGISFERKRKNRPRPLQIACSRLRSISLVFFLIPGDFSSRSPSYLSSDLPSQGCRKNRGERVGGFPPTLPRPTYSRRLDPAPLRPLVERQPCRSEKKDGKNADEKERTRFALLPRQLSIKRRLGGFVNSPDTLPYVDNDI